VLIQLKKSEYIALAKYRDQYKFDFASAMATINAYDNHLSVSTDALGHYSFHLYLNITSFSIVGMAAFTMRLLKFIETGAELTNTPNEIRGLDYDN